METKGLIFIPDISGFTRFIGEMEISHSRLIVQELLETLINANKIGLEISEIEGDAILFYKFSGTPNLEEIYKQVEKMFVEFHKQLIAYDHRRFCQCTACMSAINLTLKVITHYGEFTGYNVHNFNKLIGKDIIIAHRLLKNDIPHNEYWLVTNDMLPDNSSNTSPTGFAEWMKWNKSVKQTEIGDIFFYYTQLGPLKEGVTAEPLSLQEISDKVKVLSVTRDYQTNIITLFHATGDYNYRGRWQDGVKAIEEVNHFLPRVGMKCRYILENGEEVIYATSYSFSPERIEFSESDDKKKKTIYYLLEKINDNTTRLTIDYYLQDNLSAITIFKLSKKKKIDQSFNKSLDNLEKVVREIKIPQKES